MSKPAILLFSLLFIIILISGSLGLETQAACDQQYAQTGQLSDQIVCYHEAAMTYAYAGDSTTAQTLCQDIVTDFGTGYTPDINQRAELEANDCYFDIAKILAQPDICNNIQEDAGNTQLSGGLVTSQMCISESTNLQNLNTANYFQSPQGKGSLCNALFIMPLIVFGAIAAGRRR
jgi:hypothetical protein